MKNYQILCAAALLSLAACTTANKAGSGADSVSTDAATTAPAEKTLYGVIKMKDTIKAGDSVLMDFTVYNGADTAMKFCKWHTPFERLMSSYLEIRNEKGEEAAYSGIMAKRVMPPPAETYITLKSKESVTSHLNLLEGYQIQAPGKYTVKYTGENVSGVIVKDSITFVYQP